MLGVCVDFFWLLSQKLFLQSSLYVYNSVINPRETHSYAGQRQKIFEEKGKKHRAFILKASLDYAAGTHTGINNVNEFGLDGDDNEEKFTTQEMGWTGHRFLTHLNIN